MKGLSSLQTCSKDTLRILKALADETRLEIIQMLCREEMCACKILKNFDITQPTLSYHLRILTECGLLDSKREGAWIHYTLNQAAFAAVSSFFSDLCESCSRAQKTLL